MAHLDTSSVERGTPHPEWYKVGSQIGALTNTIAGRYDIVGLASPEAGSGAPACFKPQIAEIELNTAIAFGQFITPEMIGDLNDRDSQYDFPMAVGVIAHEAFHAKYSKWNLESAYEALRSDEYRALNLLEESRIEAQGIKDDPRYRVFIRSSALELAIGDLTAFTGGSVEELAQLVGLVHGRIIADIIDIEEVEEVLDIVEAQLGRDTVEKLSSILRKFQAYDNHSDITGAYPLAIEWAKIIRELSEERGETPTEEQKKIMQKIMEKLSESSDGVGVKNYSELSDQRTEEEWKEEVESRAEQAKESKEHKKVSGVVFGRGTGPDETVGTTSRLKERRKATSAERSAAVVVSRMLEKAKYRERDITEEASVLPPGRLRTKALVQAAALKEKGVRSEVEPWRKTVRKHTEDPNLTVGVMVDISGSMSAAMEPMATTAWVMSEAVKRVQGKCAMVYYGTDVFATLKPGQHLEEVAVYSAPDGTEKFNKAFKALNGSLDLLDTNGAKLLVVVSDGRYQESEQSAARKWVNRCEKAGVAVLWVTYNGSGVAQRMLRGSLVGFVEGTTDATEMASEIGATAARLLTGVGKRNS